jgi:hypothetical protein
MRTSEQINELAEALALAQGEIQDPVRKTENAYFSTDKKKAFYAELAAVLKAIRPVFSRHGLSLVQSLSSGLETVTIKVAVKNKVGNNTATEMQDVVTPVLTVVTRINHRSGQWIEDSATIPYYGSNMAQAFGSASAYLRRYSAQAFAAIAQDDDDDGAEAGKKEEKPRTVVGDDLETLRKKLIEAGADEAAFLKFFKVAALEELPLKDYAKAVGLLNQKAQKKEGAT